MKFWDIIVSSFLLLAVSFSSGWWLGWIRGVIRGRKQILIENIIRTEGQKHWLEVEFDKMFNPKIRR